MITSENHSYLIPILLNTYFTNPNNINLPYQHFAGKPFYSPALSYSLRLNSHFPLEPLIRTRMIGREKPPSRPVKEGAPVRELSTGTGPTSNEWMPADMRMPADKWMLAEKRMPAVVVEGHLPIVISPSDVKNRRLPSVTRGDDGTCHPQARHSPASQAVPSLEASNLPGGNFDFPASQNANQEGELSGTRYSKYVARPHRDKSLRFDPLHTRSSLGQKAHAAVSTAERYLAFDQRTTPPAVSTPGVSESSALLNYLMSENDKLSEWNRKLSMALMESVGEMLNQTSNSSYELLRDGTATDDRNPPYGRNRGKSTRRSRNWRGSRGSLGHGSGHNTDSNQSTPGRSSLSSQSFGANHVDISNQPPRGTRDPGHWVSHDRKGDSRNTIPNDRTK